MIGPIESGVPLPDPAGCHVSRRSLDGGTLGKAMTQLQIGDSFLTDKTLQAISAAALRSGTHVTSRKEGNLYRVWRSA